MGTINQVKQLAEADTPLLFFACTLPSGDTEYWSTNAIAFEGQAYSARVLKHNLFDLQLSADDAMDGISQLSLTLANADSALSELNAAIGFKGSKLTVYFAFADLPSGTITTETTVLFRGTAGDPDLITEETLTLTFSNKLSLQRIPIPEVRVQRSCPWNFPATPQQRAEAKDGGEMGRYSPFYRCGYSADIVGGSGNLNAGQAFTSCDRSRAQCIQRGMFSQDAQRSNTGRFGGYEFVPSAINVRTVGDKTSHLSPLLANGAKFNDPIPLIYGTGWLKAPVIFGRNDGNLTHLEALLNVGTIQSVLKVVVEDVEIPQFSAGDDMSTSGWYKLISAGTRNGNFDFDFVDTSGNPVGDPYGSAAVLSVVVPNRISSGKSLPTIEVLLQGLQLDVYSVDSTLQATQFTNNPAWVILDILRRCGWSLSDLNIGTFSQAAAFCGELITTTDLNGNVLQVPRYGCNLILTRRQSAASVVRGIRVAASLMLRYGPTGLLELLPETTITRQQASLPDGSNSMEQIEGGWPAYQFSDGSASYSGILRNADGSSSVRLSSRTVSETSNRLSVEFQDESNEYQQDSLSLVDGNDSALIGYEISSQSLALGIANFSQATRVLLRQLDKSTKGNLFIQFQTSFRALKVRPGDIIAITYLKEGFLNALFRVTKLSPAMNYQAVTILAQVHDDAWYSDDPTTLINSGRQPGTSVGLPKPLLGTIAHHDANGLLEYFDFGVQEQIRAQTDGSATDTLSVTFTQPSRPSANLPNLPLVSLSPQYSIVGGTLNGYRAYYYAVTAVDSAGNEGPLSFTISAFTPLGSNTNQVVLQELSFPKAAASFNVYRGVTPQQLYRIASNVPMSTSYNDAGAPEQPVSPPDTSFDHANFYFRYEYAGPFPTTTSSASTLAFADMGATSLAYAGMVVRIIEGTGRGQERLIISNDVSTLIVNPAWSTVPDTTSVFVISEGSWRFAAVSATSPVRFEIAYQAGTAIQISGRAANVINQEVAIDISPITRCLLGGGQVDLGVPSIPSFTLTVPGGGICDLSLIGFLDLTNTSSITTGTLQIFAWDELATATPLVLASALDSATESLPMASIASLTVGDVLQIGSELVSVISLGNPLNTAIVSRGVLGSVSSSHSIGDSIFRLTKTTSVVAFASGFFENRASQNYLHTMTLPDVRICAAEFYVTNSFGNSLANQVCYLSATQSGLRTLSGGQFSFQVSGFINTQQNAAMPFFMQAAHAVRDVRANLTQAAAGYKIAILLLQNGVPYCSLEIDGGSTNSSSIADGLTLLPLVEGAALTINVTVIPQQGYAGSLSLGRDLTVTVRL